MSDPNRRPFSYLRRRPATVDAELDEELRHHLEMRAGELRARGLSPEDARREALRRFGDLAATREYCRRQDRAKESRAQLRLLLEDLVQDLRIGLRSLARAPVLTATIVATVGLGIGATTVILAAVDAALFRPLPYADPDRLVRIYTDSPPNKFPFSVADYLALDAQQTRFERVAGYASEEMAWTDGTTAERLIGREVTWTYFGLLGQRPALGRDFTEADGRPGGPLAVIVSHGFWQRRLGGRADAIGEPVRLDGRDYALVGVLPREVGPLEQRQQFFVAAQWTTPPRKGPFFIRALGRLRPDVDRRAAAEELRAIDRRIFPAWKVSYQDERASWGLMDLKDHVVGDVGAIAGLASGAVLLVWLIACANASSLLVARVISRRRELAVRAALGAARGRVVRHLMAESLLLALASAALGIGVATAGVALLRDFGAGYFPRTGEIALDGRVAWVVAALAAASALLFGLVPAVHGTGGPAADALRSGRTSTAGVGGRRLRRLLVGSQFAIAAPLLVAAFLLLASLAALGRVDLGFDGRRLVSGSISLPRARYAEPARVAAFWDELQRRVEAIPGIAGVAYADGRAPADVDNFNNFEVEEAPTPDGHHQPITPWVAVTPEYFGVLGLPLVEGRLFDERDGRGPNLEAVIVDRAWARRFFPHASPVGKRLQSGGCITCPWTVVVGVVGSVKYEGLDKADEGTVYTPLPGRGGPAPAEAATARFRYVVLRAAIDAPAVVPDVRRALRELDPELPLSDVATTDELLDRALQRPRWLALLVGAVGAVALLLSVVGIYGVMAHYVQQHARDIGIRLALGGRPGQVLGLVVGQGLGVVTSGIAVGLLAALGLARSLSSLLFGVGTMDALAYLVVGALLLAAALVASFVPARRAISLPPAVVLRDD